MERRNGIIQSPSAIFVYWKDARHLRDAGHLKSTTPKSVKVNVKGKGKDKGTRERDEGHVKVRVKVKGKEEKRANAHRNKFRS